MEIWNDLDRISKDKLKDIFGDDFNRLFRGLFVRKLRYLVHKYILRSGKRTYKVSDVAFALCEDEMADILDRLREKDHSDPYVVHILAIQAHITDVVNNH